MLCQLLLFSFAVGLLKCGEVHLHPPQRECSLDPSCIHVGLHAWEKSVLVS